MKTKKVKLSTGKEVKVRELSIDEVDFCNDASQIKYDKDGDPIILNLSKSRTAWLRKGLSKSEDELTLDKTIKSFSETEKNELLIEIKELQDTGEENPSQ